LPLFSRRFSIKTNFGVSSRYKAIDGYQFSFDFGIPIIKSLEISPTFTFMSSLPKAYHENGWDTYSGVYTGWSNDGPMVESTSGDIVGSVDIVLLFKPFSLFNNPKLKKHELALGGGYGLKSYAMTRAQYEITDPTYELVGFSTKTNVGFEPYYAKIFYNYYFTETIFSGLTASINSYDGEGIALFGVQFGISFGK